MSTGNQPDGPDLYFASGDNLTRRDVQRNEEGFSGIQSEGYNIGPTEDFTVRVGEGSPPMVFNNYGRMTVIYGDGGGQPVRGWAGDGGVDWGYEQWKKQKYADENFSYQSGAWDGNERPFRPADLRRQALLDDGRALDDMYRREMERASFSRNYDGRIYNSPGQYSGISYPGQDRDFGYYPDGGSLYHKGMPWYVNDCFGNGHRHGQNGDMRAVRNILRSIVSLADDNNHRSDGYWDRGHRRGLSHLDRLVGNQWDTQMFSQGDYGPSYGNWRGRHHQGGNDFTNKALPIISEIAMAAAAIDRNNDINNYRPFNGGDNYYHERNQSMRVAMNREEALARRERQAARIRQNREDAMARRELV